MSESARQPVSARHPRPAHERGASPGATDRPSFTTVLRGYDRVEVDAHVDGTHRLVERLRADLAVAESRIRDGERHAEGLEQENRANRARLESAPTPPDEGFGVRAERLLRLAEQEAAEVRSEAAAEAAALRQQVRADVERQRHAAEQALIARSAQFDKHAAQRTAELQRREQQVAEQLTAARAEAEAVKSAGRRAADQYRQRVEADVEEARIKAAAEVAQLHEQAQEEAARLTAVEHGVRTELQRLSVRLTQELARHAPRPRDAGGQAGPDNRPRASEPVGAAEAQR